MIRHLPRHFVTAILIAWSFTSLSCATRPAQLQSGFGHVTDPDGDCQIKIENDKLTLTVPGTVHDLSANYDKKNAPRVLQEWTGDFAIQVKVTGEFDPGDEPVVADHVAFNGAGLLLWDGAANYIRLERAVMVAPNGQAHAYTPLLEYWQKGENIAADTGRDNPFLEGKFSYLKLSRRGKTIQAAISADGQKWFKAGAYTPGFSQTIKIGVMAINTSKKPFVVEFSDLKVTK